MSIQGNYLTDGLAAFCGLANAIANSQVYNARTASLMGDAVNSIQQMSNASAQYWANRISSATPDQVTALQAQATAAAQQWNNLLNTASQIVQVAAAQAQNAGSQMSQVVQFAGYLMQGLSVAIGLLQQGMR